MRSIYNIEPLTPSKSSFGSITCPINQFSLFLCLCVQNVTVPLTVGTLTFLYTTLKPHKSEI